MLVLEPVVTLKSSLPGISPFWGVANTETGESTCMKKLVRGNFLTGTWLLGELPIGERNLELEVWFQP